MASSDSRFEGVSRSLLALTRRLSSVASTVSLHTNCSARGMFLDARGDCQLPRPPSAENSGMCTNSTIGQLRFNASSSLLEVCSFTGPNGTADFNPVYKPPPVGSEFNPARSGVCSWRMHSLLRERLVLCCRLLTVSHAIGAHLIQVASILCIGCAGSHLNCSSLQVLTYRHVGSPRKPLESTWCT